MKAHQRCDLHILEIGGGGARAGLGKQDCAEVLHRRHRLRFTSEQSRGTVPLVPSPHASR